jgi:hypothetical protein
MGTTTIRRIAVGRIIGLVLAAIGIGISIYFAREAMRMNAQFHEWLQARPMETVIDLSRPGETTVPFNQTCSISHGEDLYLKCDLDDTAKENPEELLKGLSATVVISKSNGEEIETLKINNKTAHHWDGKVVLAGFAPFRQGNYVATIRIDSGAPALADRAQTIYAKYQLCGLEQMPAMVAGGFALGAGIIGFVSAVCVIPGLLTGGFFRTIPEKAEEPSYDSSG